MFTLSSFSAYWLALFGLLAIAPLAQAQQDAKPEQATEIAELLGSLKQQLAAETKLDQPAKDAIQASITSTEANAAAIRVNQAELAQLENLIKTAEKRANEFKAEFEALNSKQAEASNEDIKPESLNAKVQDLTTTVDELNAQLKANESASNLRVGRSQNLRQKQEAQTERITQLNAQLEKLAADKTLAAQATQFELQSELALSELKKSIMQAEVRRDEAEEQFALLKQQHDLIELRIQRSSSLKKELEALQLERLKSKAVQEVELAESQQAKIEKSADNALKLLLPSYKINTDLATKAKRVEEDAAKAKAESDKLKSAVENLKKQFNETEVRVKRIGLTASVGALLRKRRADLLAPTNLGTYNDAAKSKIDELQYDIFDVDQLREDLSPKQIQLEIENVSGPQDAKVWESLEKPIDEVIEIRKEKLNSVKNSLNRLFKQLLDVQQFDSSRRKTTAKFRVYINERILWIRSNNLLFSKLTLDESDKIAFDPGRLSDAGGQVLQALGLAGLKPGNLNSAVSVTETPLDDEAAETKSEAAKQKRISSDSYLRLPIAGLAAVIAFLLILFKGRMRKEIDALGVEAARGSCVSFWPTSRALFLTIAISMSLPAIPLLLGWAIVSAPFKGSVLFYAIGRALIAASLFAIPLEILRRMARPQGIARQHFDWSDNSVSKLKKNLDWGVLPAVLLTFAIELLHNLDLVHRVDLLERVLFIGAMLFVTYFLYRTYNAKTGLFSGYIAANEKSWISQTSTLWLGFILFMPLSFAGLAFWGYYYTALNLAECAYATLVLGLVVEIIRGSARRFILVKKRNAFIVTAKRKRQARLDAEKAQREEERKLAKAAAAEGDEPLPDMITATTESLESLTEIQPEEIEENIQQAYKLISLSMLLIWFIGIWMIWTDVLPALKQLDDYTLWPNQVVENGFDSADMDDVPSATDESSGDSAAVAVPLPMASLPASSTTETATPAKRVTVRDLLLFFIIAIVTWIAATNLPSAFEILFLDALPVDRSFRYAIKALTSYGIVMLGVLLAFRSLSIGWENVQWLVTALTFGLAFGLQEIFANFVAGIILMFERPMRIGDLITVDEFTGVVTKIRTRATTLVNWDRKEYVIPNKDFITGRLVNWTLSDSINRVEMNVGVAYGSDVELAKSTLYEILRKHPKIVSEPKSQVVFDQFADSSLNLRIKCFVGDVDSRPQVIDSLHTLINTAFNEAGIEISFPQRDLHLRTIDGVAADALRNSGKGNS